VNLEPVLPRVYFAAVYAQVALLGVSEIADDGLHLGATPVEERGIAAATAESEWRRRRLLLRRRRPIGGGRLLRRGVRPP